MGEVTSISLDETNRIRASLGLKTIPRRSSSSKRKRSVSSQEDAKIRQSYETKPPLGIKKNPKEQENSILEETKVSTGYDNSHELKSRIATIKKSTSSNVQEENTDDWLSKVGRPNQKPKVSKVVNSEKISDVAINNTVKVSHDIESMETNKPIILTLKESTLDDGQDTDILQDEKTLHDLEDAKNIKLRQLNNDRKLNKISIMGFEDEDIAQNEELQLLDIRIDGTLSSNTSERLDRSVSEDLSGKRKIILESDSDFDEAPNDYVPTKIKKRKKKSNQSSESKTTAISKMIKVDLIDEDNEDFEGPIINVRKRTVEDESELEAAEQVALERIETLHRAKGVHIMNPSKKGLVLDEMDGFLDSLKTNLLEERVENKPIMIDLKQTKPASELSKPPINDPVESQGGKDGNMVDFSQGIAGTLSFLKERKIITPAQTYSNSKHSRNQHDIYKEFQALEDISKVSKASKDLEANAVRTQFSEEELQKIKNVNDQEIALKAHTLQSEKLRHYNPDVKLSYKDSKGNELTTKEAYKQISQSWHGTKSNKKKLAKQEKKFEERKKQIERDSYLGL